MCIRDSLKCKDGARFFYASGKDGVGYYNRYAKEFYPFYNLPTYLSKELQFFQADGTYVDWLTIKENTRVVCPFTELCPNVNPSKNPSGVLYLDDNNKVTYYCHACKIFLKQPHKSRKAIAINKTLMSYKDILETLQAYNIYMFIDKETSEYIIIEDNKEKIIPRSQFTSIIINILHSLTGKFITLSKDDKALLLNALPRYYRVFKPWWEDKIRGTYFNIYTKTNTVKPVPTDRTELHEFPAIDFLLEGILPEKYLRERFVRYVAKFYQTKRPSDCAWLFKGKQGTGKNLMFSHIIEPLFGKEWCGCANTISESKFNNILANKCWILFNEVFGTESKYYSRVLLSSMAKKYIGSNASFIIDGKYKRQYEYTNAANYLFFTNENTPTNIEKTDRRYIVISTGQPLKERCSNIPALLYKVRTELPKFAFYLLSLNVPDTEYHKKIYTEAGKILYQVTCSRYEDFVDNMFNIDWLISNLHETDTTTNHILTNIFKKKRRNMMLESLTVKEAYQIFINIYKDRNLTLIGFQKKLKEYNVYPCLLYTSPSPRDLSTSRMPSSA